MEAVTSIVPHTTIANRFHLISPKLASLVMTSRMAVEKFPGRQITLSLGIAEFARNGDTAEAVLAAADAALYQSKRTGRDRVIKAK